MAVTERGPSRQQALRAHSPYPYLQGLDYLRAHSTEQEALAETVGGLWGPTALNKPPNSRLRICDYGCGFGDLILDVLSRLSPRPRGGHLDIELVDINPPVARHAGRLLEARLPASTIASTPKRFFRSVGNFDLILASHVLYYVRDRDGVVAALLKRLNPGGTASVVLRSELCDTFAIRSAIRSATPPAQRSGWISTKRVTSGGVASVIDSHALEVTTCTRHSEIRVPAEEVDLSELGSTGPVRPAAELIRLIAHIPPGTLVADSVTDALRRELHSRLDGSTYRFALADEIVSGTSI
jgi:SAM-dependent methyltransferase